MTQRAPPIMVLPLGGPAEVMEAKAQAQAAYVAAGFKAKEVDKVGKEALLQGQSRPRWPSTPKPRRSQEWLMPC